MITARTARGRRRPGSAAAFLVGLVAAAAVLGAPSRPACPAPQDVEEGAAALGGIDEAVQADLARLGIAQAPLCSDATFVRRASLDLIGTLPTAAEVRAFLADGSPDKRSALVDRLLERPEYADYWAMKWCNLLRVKSEFPINLWPNAVQAYHRWIRESLHANLPYDRFVREMLTSSGSNFRVPQVNFWRAVQKKDPATLARAVALTFMGARAEKWPKERFDGMAAFFSRVGYKTTAEWKEEIVFFDAGKPMPAAKPVFPDGTPAALQPGRDPRATFADWLIDAKNPNPWFARSIANRVWSWMLGAGVVHEPDDLREDNPPSNPELLEFLERALVVARYDVKHLFRLIAKSRAYQSSCVPASQDARAAAHFAHYAVRRLEPEVLIDAIDLVTGTTETYVSRIPEPFTYVPTEKRSIELADASISSPFLDLFGRSPRDTGLESEQRDALPTAAQRLHLLNSSHVRRKLTDGPALRALLQGRRSPRDAVDALYLAILSRRPTAEDLAVLESFGRAGAGRGGASAAIDVAWALFNSAEFQYRH